MRFKLSVISHIKVENFGRDLTPGNKTTIDREIDAAPFLDEIADNLPLNTVHTHFNLWQLLSAIQLISGFHPDKISRAPRFSLSSLTRS